MKITIYELLGLIKDGKAPKKFLYKGKKYYLANNDDEYYDKPKGYGGNAFKWNLVIFEGLNDEIEILDEEDEFIDIYSLCDNSEQYNFSSRQTGMTKEDRRLLDSNFKELLIVVNQLIKNQKKIIERLSNEGN